MVIEIVCLTCLVIHAISSIVHTIKPSEFRFVS